MKTLNWIKTLRWLALLEGLSLLLLLFVAMPLKYGMDKPLMVEIVGMAHGVLFILYSIFLAVVSWKQDWIGIQALLSFLASFVPFGTFIADKRYFSKMATEA